MQKIRFGLSLDGQRGWHPRDALGDSTVGPLGMLGLLELRLGLVRLMPSQAERVVQMRACLQMACHERRFYARSFQADELGTAATLLAWRDQWFEHGWDGRLPVRADGRLRDMVEVEELAREQVAPGVGERLTEVLAALQERAPQIDRIELVDPLDAFPLAWRRVLERLPISLAPVKLPGAEPGSVLAALQAGLLQSQLGETPTPVAWCNDGSVRIVQAQTRLSGAQWLAHRIRQASPDHVVVAERDGSMLDAALDALDLPRLGLSEPSPYRPTLQLLPLVMRLMWQPLDFHALLQFLSHPVNPLEPFARGRIAEKVADAPGIGGQGWAAMLEDINAHYGDRAADVRQAIDEWINHRRFSAQEGAPLTVLYERVARVAEYFRNRLTDEDEARRAGWLAGHGQAMAVQQAIGSLIDQGVGAIRPEALDKLVLQATSRGSANPLLGAQAGAGACVTDPAAMVESFDEVLWWSLAAVPLVPPYPWSPGEISVLRQSGVELPDTDALLLRQASGWLVPVLHARRTLTLVLPPAGEEVHPVWLLLSGILANAEVEKAEDVLTAAPKAGRTVAVDHLPLPVRRRWWQLPDGVTIPWPESMSFTSLEQLLFNPYQWMLNYPARLHSSALLCLPDDFRLLGNLAHRVVERLYQVPGSMDWTRERVLDWFDAHLDAIIGEEGAVLLMPGKRADLESFRLRFRASLPHLHAALRGAGASSIEPEAVLEGEVSLGRLTGSADLLLTLASGERAIVDMKWAGEKKYRQKLATLSHVQLAIYARLVALRTGSWPQVGYYILRKGEMLTTSAGLFPGVRAVDPPEGTSIALLWERVRETWAWRKTQVEAGAIELVFDGLAPTEASAPPEDALPIEPLDPRYNPFVCLAGWEE